MDRFRAKVGHELDRQKLDKSWTAVGQNLDKRWTADGQNLDKS